MVQMKLPAILLSILVHSYALKFVEKAFQRPNLQVVTDSGIVQGVKVKSNNVRKGYFYAFLGIPYAQPPLGELRFKAPNWVENWSGVLDGSREASNCVEILIEFEGNSKIIGSEDCLFLNVFTGTNPTKNKPLKPVMVFIHGGGFWFGSSDFKMFGPDCLVSKDVIVVTFNYRLSVFGFLSTEDEASPGNYGLKDQNLVLRWIQENIKYFGGDPDNVLLFGQSAGAVSVTFHMLSPKSRGLFHRVILQSGSALCIWATQKKPRNIAYLLGVANGITNPRGSQDLVDKLRKIDIDDMKRTLLPVLASALTQITTTGLPFSPSFEDDHEDAFLTRDYWYEMVKNGDFNRVPVLMGTNMNESLFLLHEMEILKPIFVLWDLDNSLIPPPDMNITDKEVQTYVGAQIKERFIGNSSRFVTTDIKNLVRYYSQDSFARPLWKTGELMSKYVPLYFYQFRYESQLGRLGLGPKREYPGVRGVAHAEEIFFIFNKLNNDPKKKADILVRERMTTMWTNFAKYSNPTPVEPRRKDVLGDLVWPLFASAENSQTTFLAISESMKISNISEDHDDLLWWDRLYEKYGNPPFISY